MYFFFTPLSYEHNYGVSQDPQIVHLILYMNGNTQGWIRLFILFIYLFCSIDPTAWGHRPTGYRMCQKLYSIK
jgi:hypothetical protein